MFSTLRTRFGIPGVISVIALVFAMFGGAYAASNNSSGGGKAAASAKAKKGPRGPKGPKGATGPAGPQGPTGPQGPKGDAGAAGANGKDGTSGAPGTSATSKSLSIGNPNCEFGGSEFSTASGITYACNGEEGPEGPAGSPWVVNGLPPGKSEMGTFSVGIAPPPTEEEEEIEVFKTIEQLSPISFTVPLAPAASISVHYVNNEGNEESEGGVVAEPATVCTGEAGAPTAPPGVLCVYALFSFRAKFQFPQATYRGGTVLDFSLEPIGRSAGSWAVTAPTS